MLRFFKSSLPAQLLVLLALVLALRLPLLWLGLPVSAAELRLLLLGEGVAGGAWPYRDLYDGTAPLAAAGAGLLELAWNRPVLLYRAAALGILLVQALRFNAVLNRADVHPERGYLAALTYLVMGSLTTDLDTLSPLLVGHTFIIFALSALIPTSREGYDNRRLFRAGFLVGLAALCYLPLAFFVGLGLFAVVIFAANSFRSALLLVCGFLSPYAHDSVLPGQSRPRDARIDDALPQARHRGHSHCGGHHHPARHFGPDYRHHPHSAALRAEHSHCPRSAAQQHRPAQPRAGHAEKPVAGS